MTVRALQELEKAKRFIEEPGRRKMALGCAQNSVYLLKEANPTSPQNPLLVEAQRIVERCLLADAKELELQFGAANEWLQRHAPQSHPQINALDQAWKFLLTESQVSTRSKGGVHSPRALPRQLLSSYQGVLERLTKADGVLSVTPLHFIRIKYPDSKVWVVKTDITTNWGTRRLHLVIASNKQ